MLDLLTSNMATCTVLRLAARLAFAAYILHPQLSGTRPGNDTYVHTVGAAMTVLTLTSRFESSWMIKAVRTYLSRSYSTKLTIPQSDQGDFTFKWSLRDRVLFATILVLCSVGNLFYLYEKYRRI
jgi:hypothetical protein